METNIKNEVTFDVSPRPCEINEIWGDGHIYDLSADLGNIHIESFFDPEFDWVVINAKNYIPVHLLKELAEIVSETAVTFDLNGNGTVDRNLLEILIPVYYCKALFTNVIFNADDYLNYDALVAGNLIDKMETDANFKLFRTMCRNKAESLDSDASLQGRILEYFNDNENELHKLLGAASEFITQIDPNEIGKVVTPMLMKVVDLLCTNPILKKVIIQGK